MQPSRKKSPSEESDGQYCIHKNSAWQLKFGKPHRKCRLIFPKKFRLQINRRQLNTKKLAPAHRFCISQVIASPQKMREARGGKCPSRQQERQRRDLRAKNYTQKEQSNFCCNIQGHVDTERKINFTLQLYREGARGARAPRKGASPTKKGLNCRPLWHFCKQKSPIPSQLPHGFGFWLSFRRWLDYWGRSARTKNWRKVRKAFYWISELSDFEGIGAICTANRRKGQRPFYGSGTAACRQNGGFGEKLRWRAY